MKPADEKASYDKSLRPVRTPGQLGDWATLVVLVLAAGFWFLWPSEPPRRSGAWQLPEPSCAYGVLSPSSSAGDVLGHFAASARNGDSPDAFSRIPAVDVPSVPDPSPAQPAPIPPPVYAGGDLLEPVFLVPAPPFPFRTDLPVPTGVVAHVSSPLRAAGFSFDPPGTTNEAPFALKAVLAFGPRGDVESPLVDAFTGPDDLLLSWRTALQLSRAATNVVGAVDISRAAPAVSL